VLTKRQHELLSFLIQHQKQHGMSPSYDEMRQHLNLQSKSTVHSLVEGLEKRGYCKRSPHAARTIEVIKTPDQDKLSDMDISPKSQGTEIPFFGVLPSTISLDFLDHPKETFQIVRDHFPDGDLFSLAIQGDFLKEWGILNGDTLILKKETGGTHDTLTLVSVGHELMLRHYGLEGSRISLKTANKYMIPRVESPDNITIHGVVVGLFRKMKA
jgi:repressor LexA